MAAKKRKSARTSADDSELRGFTVVLEDLRAQFGVFGEALQGLREHMDARFEQVDARFAEIHRELGLVKSVAIDHGRQLADHGRQLVDHGKQLKEIRRSLETIETKLDAKVDRSEVVTIVESALSKRR